LADGVLSALTKMKKLRIPRFKTYEEEAAVWDELDTAPYMEDDGAWFRFDASNPDEPAQHRLYGTNQVLHKKSPTDR
jgi:hypothetical protein